VGFGHVPSHLVLGCGINREILRTKLEGLNKALIEEMKKKFKLKIRLTILA